MNPLGTYLCLEGKKAVPPVQADSVLRSVQVLAACAGVRQSPVPRTNTGHAGYSDVRPESGPTEPWRRRQGGAGRGGPGWSPGPGSGSGAGDGQSRMVLPVVDRLRRGESVTLLLWGGWREGRRRRRRRRGSAMRGLRVAFTAWALGLPPTGPVSQPTFSLFRSASAIRDFVGVIFVILRESTK